jgi:hypothetical protein
MTILLSATDFDGVKDFHSPPASLKAQSGGGNFQY